MRKKLLWLGTALLLTNVVGCNDVSSEPTSLSETSTSSIVDGERPDEGYGTYTDDVGNEYNGEFLNGKFHGYGTMYYINGDYYEGTWIANKKEGHGKMIFDTACVYVGEFDDDNMHGVGYMSWPMGDYYFGEWRHGDPNGHGTKAFMQDPTGITNAEKYHLYVGQMRNGLLHGYGVMSYNFGGVYKGMYENSARVGHGVYYWEETNNPDIIWLKFEGEFSIRYDGGGWIDGEGTMYYKDGRTVTGTWRGVDLIE